VLPRRVARTRDREAVAADPGARTPDRTAAAHRQKAAMGQHLPQDPAPDRPVGGAILCAPPAVLLDRAAGGQKTLRDRGKSLPI
jgi:hypothetical protein